MDALFFVGLRRRQQSCRESEGGKVRMEGNRKTDRDLRKLEN